METLLGIKFHPQSNASVGRQAGPIAIILCRVEIERVRKADAREICVRGIGSRGAIGPADIRRRINRPAPRAVPRKMVTARRHRERPAQFLNLPTPAAPLKAIRERVVRVLSLELSQGLSSIGPAHYRG